MIHITNITLKKFLYYIVLLIVVDIIAASAIYALIRSGADSIRSGADSKTIRDRKSYTQPIYKILPQGVSVDIVLSSLSLPKGKVDVFWDLVIPEEQKWAAENRHFIWLYGYTGAIAEPLDLIEELEINNHGSDTIFLESLANEQINTLSIPPRYNEERGRATPIMLLPDVFLNETGEEIACHNRNIKGALTDLADRHGAVARNYMKNYGKGTYKLNNICEFETPIEILPGTSLTLKPKLYAIEYGLLAQNVVDIFDAPSKTFVTRTLNAFPFQGTYLLTPKNYEEFDEVANKHTFDIGGFIVADSHDEAMINNILKIRDGDGHAVRTAINRVMRNDIEFKAYITPDEPFSPLENIFDENILGMQIFWYMNDFWKHISGIYDYKTKEMLKTFQRKTGLVQTGKFDEATMFVTRAFYKNDLFPSYGDEVITAGLDGPESSFRLFSSGSQKVTLSYDAQNPKFINDIPIYSYTSFWILNNTAETAKCSGFNDDNIIEKESHIAPNEIYKIGSLNGIRHIQCGNKVMDIELQATQTFPQKNGSSANPFERQNTNPFD